MMLTTLLSANKAGPADATEVAVTARVAVSPLLVSLELDPAVALPGQSVKTRATVANLGPGRVGPVVVELRTDDGLTVRGGRLTIQSLRGGKPSTIRWSLCGETLGSYLVLAQATLGGTVTESPARLMTIVEGPPREC